MGEWTLIRSDIFARKLKRYYKKHPRETDAVLKNLQTFADALGFGDNPQIFDAGFIHREPKGIVAIGQGGMKGGAKETRLYIYVVEADSVVHLLTIGDKDSQKNDINACKELVKSL